MDKVDTFTWLIIGNDKNLKERKAHGIEKEKERNKMTSE